MRRQIVNMSIADEFYVHLFPDNTPVNIANPADLRRLREMFPTEELYIVVGSDVIHNRELLQEGSGGEFHPFLQPHRLPAPW